MIAASEQIATKEIGALPNLLWISFAVVTIEGHVITSLSLKVSVCVCKRFKENYHSSANRKCLHCDTISPMYRLPSI